MTIDPVSEDRYFSPDADGSEDSAYVGFTLSELARVTVVVTDAAGAVVRHVMTDSPREHNSQFSWDGRPDGSTATVADGSYGYTISAEVQSGDTATRTGRIGVDTGPVASFSSPDADSAVTGQVDVTIRPAVGRSLADYSYLYRCQYQGRCGQGWLGYLGVAQFDGSRSLTWDTGEAPTGDQYLWGWVYYGDAYGAQHAYSLAPHHVTVIRPPAIRDVSADRYFSPDGDGQEDAATVYYTLTAPASVSVRVRDANGETVRRLVTGVATGEGGQMFGWDGRDDDGALMPDAVYGYVIEADGGDAPAATAAGRIGIDTAGVPALVAPVQDAMVTGTVAVTLRPSPGKTLVAGGYVYRCVYESRCAYGYVGSFGSEDLDGTQSLAWDTAESPTGDQYLWGYAYFQDAFNQFHTYQLALRHVKVTRPPQITNVSQDRYFSPDGDGQEDRGYVSYSLSAPAASTVQIRDSAGDVVRQLLTAQPVGEGYNSFDWDGRDDEGALVADGAYAYTLEAEASEGPTVSVNGRLGVDTAPIAHIDAPAADADVTGQVAVAVQPAAGRTLNSGSVYRCHEDSRCGTQFLGWLGDADVSGRRTVLWDTDTSTTGLQYIWSSVFYDDAFGAGHNFSVPSRRLTVARPAAISSVGEDRYFSPDGDAQEDTGAVTYTLTAPATVTVEVRAAGGELVRRLQTGASADEGTQNVSWDGRDDGGEPAPDGVYTLKIEAVSGAVGATTTATATGRIGIDTQPAVSFTRPQEGAVVSGQVDVAVNAGAGRSSSIYASQLYRCYFAERCGAGHLGSLGPEDFDGTRALTWDTAESPTGDQFLWGWVYYTDAFGAVHAYNLAPRHVIVSRAVQISNVSADRYFSPDADDQEDDGGPDYCISTPADVALTIRSGDAVVRTIEAPSLAEGCHRITWDGLIDGGAAAPAGSYSYVLRAQGIQGEAATVNGRIGIRRAPPGAIVAPSPDDSVGRLAAFAFEADEAAVLNVRPCIASACATISAAGAGGRWTTNLDLLGLTSGPYSLAADIRWRDGYGSLHDSRLTLPLRVDLTAPEVELAATPPRGEAPLATKLRINARGHDEETLRYTLELGDGSAPISGTIAPPYAAVEHDHGYDRIGTFKARVEVTDDDERTAARSVYVHATKPPNRPPVASLALDADVGPAPLEVNATIGATDLDADALSYKLDWGDGAALQTGALPHAAVSHRYARPGSYSVRYAVSDGVETHVRSRRVVATLSEPLLAHAGDDIVVRVGEVARLDGGGSRPPEGIEQFSWTLGDGQRATGAAVEHTYAASGTYTATLSVTAQGATKSDDVQVRVVDPPPAAGLHVQLQSGGAPLGEGDVLVIDADGNRFSGATNSAGATTLEGLADGAYTVYGWRDGYRPGTAPATVAAGRGDVTVTLEQGEVASAGVEAERMTRDEIVDAGIDPDDPANQNVFQFEVHLAFSSDPGATITLVGIGAGDSGGGELYDLHYDGGTGCDGYCPITIDETTYIPTVHFAGGVPSLQWLIIPGKARFLKEFFDVSMVVQNLAAPGVQLRDGTAALALPAGLSLAPTAEPQQLTQSVPTIDGQQAQTVHWLVRGDDEGEYRPAVDYTGTIEPFGRSLTLHAEASDPLKIWGASALKMIVRPESRVDSHRPYRVRIGLRNVADVPVYNPSVELLHEGRLNYIEQPRERMLQGAAEVAPGDTFWTDDFVLVPKISGRLRPEYSFIKKTAGNVTLESAIEPVAQKPVAGIESRPSKDRVVLDFQPVAGADQYEVYSTDRDLDGDFPAEPLPNVQWRDATKAVVTGVDPDAEARTYAISTVEDGVHTMRHPAVVEHAVSRWPSPTTDLQYDLDCDTGTTRLRFSFEDQDFTLRDYHLKIGDGPATNLPVPASGVFEAPDAVTIPADGLHIEAWARNTEMTGDETGPKIDKYIFPCRYAGIGDSFSSGEGAPELVLNASEARRWEAGTDSEQNKCHRSGAGYPRLVEDEAIDPAGHNGWVPMTFRACSGALMADVLDKNQGDPPYTFGGKPEGPQITHIDSSVQLLTVSIGGNDAFFGDIIKNCISHGLNQAGLLKPGAINDGTDPQLIAQLLTPCRPAWDAKVANKLVDLRRDLPKLYSRLRNSIDANGRVLVVPYPHLVPAQPESCWGISSADVHWLRSTQVAANEVIRQSAIAAGVEYVDLGTRFDGHDSCRNVQDRWINGPVAPVSLTVGDGANEQVFRFQVQESFHPDRAGHRALADAVKAQIATGPIGSSFPITEGQTQRRTVTVAANTAEAMFTTEWDGSDIPMTLISPVGRRIERGDESADVTQLGGPTHDAYTVTRPEPGEWTVEIYGADVPAGGEPVRLRTEQVPEVNVAPSPSFTVSKADGPPPDLAVDLDASKSFDVDGAIRNYAWDFGDGTQASGAVAQHTYHGAGAYTPKLTVTDNEGKQASYAGQVIRVTTPPAAHDDAFDVEAGQTLVVPAAGVLSNDEDAEDDRLSVTFAGETEHGTATIGSDGRLTYVPGADFTGTDRVRYQIVDEHGATAETAEVVLTVADTVAPQTALGSHPGALTNQRRPAFAFTSEAGATFACQTDGGDYETCASPQQPATLADGPHVFRVRATDKAGNTDASAAEHTFTVDATPPPATIDSGPDEPTNDSTPTIAFSTEAGAQLQCRLDAQPFTNCASPLTLPTLSDGEHHFDVQATDAAGNTTPTPATRTLTIDTVQPALTISVPAPGQHFAVGADVASSFACQDLGGSGVASCTGPARVDTTTAGARQFAAVAADRAGNQTTQTVEYTVDAPVVQPPGGNGDPPQQPPQPTPPAVKPTLPGALPGPGLTPSSPQPKPASQLVLGRVTGTVSPRGKLRVPLTCRGAKPCAGRIKLTAKSMKGTLASAGYTVRAEGRATVSLKLTAKGRSALRRKSRLRVVLRIVPDGAGGAAITRTVTLKRAPA